MKVKNFLKKNLLSIIILYLLITNIMQIRINNNIIEFYDTQVKTTELQNKFNDSQIEINQKSLEMFQKLMVFYREYHSQEHSFSLPAYY